MAAEPFPGNPTCLGIGTPMAVLLAASDSPRMLEPCRTFFKGWAEANCAARIAPALFGGSNFRFPMAALGRLGP